MSLLTKPLLGFQDIVLQFRGTRSDFASGLRLPLQRARGGQDAGSKPTGDRA